MGENMRQVAEALQHTLQLDPVVRRAAEERVNAFEKVPGYAHLLIQLLCSEEVCEIRMAAAVALKNFVKKNWSPTPEVDINVDEEEQIRQNILDAMFNSRGNLQNQLSHTLHIIAQRDFPERWPTLVPSLAVHLSPDNLDRLVATLSAMDQLFKKFRIEAKSTVLWTELKNCLLTVQEPLTQLYKKMIEYIPQKDNLDAAGISQWLEVLLLISKVFHSLCYQDLPEYFEDNLKPWVDGFLELMKLSCPSQLSAAGEPTSLDKLKTEICEIFTLYAQRYEEEINSFMQSVIQSVWQLVVQTGQDTRYDSMVCAALEFLSIICQKTHYEGYFTGQGVLQTLAQDVCVKNLHLRQEDLELFEDEPIDYMRRDLEGTDVGTRRRGAVDLVRALCRRFEIQLVPILAQIVQSLCGNGDWLKLDVVYCLVTAMASKTETVKSGATSTSQLVDVSDYYVNQVRAHLSSNVNESPILKVDALKFVVTFRNQLRVELLIEVVQAIDRLLTSSLPVLHKYSAYALDKLLLIRNPGDAGMLLTAQVVPVGSLLTNLVAAFDKDAKAQNSPYLIKATLRIVAILDDDTARHGGAIASKLSSLVDEATKNPADPVHTHFLFETMCVLVKKTMNLPDGALDAQLMPLIETILSQDIADLIPYALQITGVLLNATAARNSSIDQYVSFIPFLLSTQLWARSANIPAALSVLEVYLRICPEVVLRQHGELVMQHYVRLIASKSLDQYGFQLAGSILPVIEMLNGVDGPISILLNNMFRRVQFSKTPKFMKQFIVFLCRFAIVRGADALAKSIETIQPGMFRMVVEKVVCNELSSLQNMTTVEDKRIIAIGISNVLANATNFIAEQYGSLAVGCAQLIEASSVSDRPVLSPEEEQAAMYNAEGEFTNPYCRLSYAPRSDPIVPEISNYKGYLAQAVLQRGPAVNSAVLGCVPAELQQHLSTYLTA